jgi:hypothetical protein
MLKGHKLVRTTALVKSQMDMLNAMGYKYTIQHGTYTTKIDSPLGIMTLSTVQFSTKVFVASNMVKRDALRTDLGKEILTKAHSKMNYSNHNKLDAYHSHVCYNIDIKGAYASCLFNNGLITYNTYEYLLALKKHERLPSVGMIAKSHIKYFYDKGECVDVQPYRSPNSELFFFLIQKIDEIMREIKWILGDYFIFYWVDGIFFKLETPLYLIDEVMAYLDSQKYQYTFEEVYQFNYVNDDGQCKVSLYRGAEGEEYKEYNFRSSTADDDLLKRMLYADANKKLPKSK